jgi:hypothetical protein
VLQAAPCLLSSGGADASTARVRLRNLLVGGASPLSNTIPDITFGAGRADALASIQKTLPVLKATQVTVSGNGPAGATLSASQLGFTDPDSCSLTRITWTGGCGASPGSNLSCPFGTTKVSVQASNNGVAFSAASDLQITVTSFSVGATPGTATVSAGQTASYTATVNAHGGEFSAPVTLACTNLPAGTSCTFNPPAVTPGTGSSSSTVTVTTTARSSSLAVVEPTMLIFGTMGLLAALLRAGGARTEAAPVGVASALASCAVFCIVAQSACGGGGSSTSSSTASASSAGTPAIALTPSSVSFGAQPVQTTSAPRTVSVTNSGTAALTIGGILASGDFGQTNNCPSSLSGGAGCSIVLTFTPTTAGARAGTLTITDNAAGSPHSVAISGTGQAVNAGGVPGTTPPGSYVIGITGQSASLVQSSSVTLVVK